VIETKREYFPVGGDKPMMTVTSQGGGRTDGRSRERSSGYESEGSRRSDHSRGSVRPNSSNRSRQQSPNPHRGRGQVRFSNRRGSGTETSGSSEYQNTRRSKEEFLETVRRASAGSSGNPRSSGGNPPNSNRGGSGYGRGRSPARLNMMQEASLVDPRVVRRPMRKVIRMGERILNQLQFLVGNVDLRKPFAKYQLQDRFFRLGLQRLKVKGVKFNGKNNWREVKLVAKRTNDEEFYVWFKCRYGLTGKVNRMKCSDLELARVKSDDSAEPAQEIMAVEENRTLGVDGTSPVSPAGHLEENKSALFAARDLGGGGTETSKTVCAEPAQKIMVVGPTADPAVNKSDDGRTLPVAMLKCAAGCRPNRRRTWVAKAQEELRSMNYFFTTEYDENDLNLDFDYIKLEEKIYVI
jgi:hypothetical protein